MAHQYPPATVAQFFLSKMDNPGMQEKYASRLQQWVRDQIRERSAARKIMPQDPITPNDCQVSLNHEQLIRIEGLEPASRAMSITFRSEGRARWAYAARFAIGFYKIGSERIEKSEEELMVYAATNIPIFKIIERNAITDIEEIEDWHWVNFSMAACYANQAALNTGGAAQISTRALNAGTVREISVCKGEIARNLSMAGDADISMDDYPLQKADPTRLAKLFVGYDDPRLQLDCMLITEHDFLDLASWGADELDTKAGDVAIEGWTYNKIVGYKYVRTLKTSVLRIGVVLGYTKPEYLGKWYVLQPPKFYMDKVANMLRWETWTIEGIGFGNIASVRMLELFAGSAVPGFELFRNGQAGVPVQGDAESLAGSLEKRPKPQKELGKVNHRAAQGQWTPTVTPY